MESNDLNAPLGQDKPKSRLSKLPVSAPQMLAAVLAFGVLVVAGWAMVAHDPLGGEPVAVISTGLPQASGSAGAEHGDGREHARRDGPDAGAVAKIPDAAKIPEGAQTVTIIDGSSGKRQEVVIPGTGKPDNTAANAAPATGKTISVTGPDGKPAPIAPAPSSAAKPGSKPEIKSEADPAKLSEKARYGMIPKIGPDGAKPLAVFAQSRNLPPALKDRPRIAVVLTGVGISASGTADAFSLPA